MDHIGDVLAIPFFAWLCQYFSRIPQRTPEQTILLAFSAAGLVADLTFSYFFLMRSPRSYSVAALIYVALAGIGLNIQYLKK